MRGTYIALALILVCLAADVVLLRFGIDDLDEGYFVQQALRVLHGQVPFRDFETLYSPGLAYLYALCFGFLGGPSLWVARTVALLCRAGIALLTYVLARPVIERQPLWAAVPGLFLLLGLDDAPIRWEPHPGWPSTFFAMLAAWCVTRGWSTRWMVASGLCAGAAYLFKQNTGVFIMAAIVVWGLVSGRTVVNRQTVVPLATFGVFTLLWLVPLAFTIDGTLLRLAVLVGVVNQASLFSPPEPSILFPLAAIAGGGWLIGTRKSSHRLFWYLLAGCALLCTQYPRMDTVHLAWSMPLLLVVGAAALDQLKPALAGLALIGLLVQVQAPVLARLEYFKLPRAAYMGIQAPAQTVDELQAVIADIRAHTQPGEPIFVYPSSPLVYALADRPNPTRYDHLNPGAAASSQIENSVIADIERADVKLVVISDYWRSAWGDPGANAELETWLDEHFENLSSYSAYRVLVRRPGI